MRDERGNKEKVEDLILYGMLTMFEVFIITAK
jgi:hypothetical protein